MMFHPSSRQLANRLAGFIPNIEQIVCSKFVNYLTLNVQTKNNQWKYIGQLLNPEHMQAVAYLQANFKNHIVNKKSLQNFEKLKDYLEDSGNDELLQNLQPIDHKIPQKNRRSFYIFDEKLSIEEIMQNQVIKNKTYNKVVCFPKEKPLQVNRQFQKFCLQHHVRALGLTQFTMKSLMNQIFKMSKNSTLIHELITNDFSIYKQESGKGVPTELILFFNQIQSANLSKKQNFPTFKQIAKNYYYRESFNRGLKYNTPNFGVCRMQHLNEAQKYEEAVTMHQLEGTDEGDRN